MKAEFRVWWIPQIPMKPFTVDIGSIEEGRKICEVLADYDLFQFENKVKPDYCNSGGIEFKFDPLTDGEWHSFPDEDDDEAEDIMAEIIRISHDARNQR